MLYRNMNCIWLTGMYNLNRSSRNVIEFVIICKYIDRLIEGARIFSLLGNVLKLKTTLNYEIKNLFKVTKKSPGVRPRIVHRKDFVGMIYSNWISQDFMECHTHCSASLNDYPHWVFLLYCKNFHVPSSKRNEKWQ